jgi:hypothetical protein
MFFLKKTLPKKDYLSVTLGDKRPSFSTVKNLVAIFRRGNLNTENEERSGRPTRVTGLENLDVMLP